MNDSVSENTYVHPTKGFLTLKQEKAQVSTVVFAMNKDPNASQYSATVITEHPFF